MNKFLWSIAVLLVVFTAAAEQDFSAIVKIFTVHSNPSYYLPWQNSPQEHSSGSGFVIAGRRIMTNAHCVANATFVSVRKFGDQTPYPAEVVSVNHECDLAVLTVKAPKFFDDITPLVFAPLPPLQSSVQVIGYPTGGDNVSVTSGILSRIEPRPYAHSGRPLLAAQVDAAINPGNSGGPVLHDGKVVGVAFQCMGSGQNIGYIVPSQVVQHYLAALSGNRPIAFPVVPFVSQTMENPDLRRSVNMRDGDTGVLIVKIPELFEKKFPLKKGDVLMKVNGKVIANDGTINYGGGKVLYYGCSFWDKYLGDKLPVTVWRDGKEVNLVLEMVKTPMEVPDKVYDQSPNYFLAGGMVFAPLNLNYLGLFRHSPAEFAVHLGKAAKEKDAQIVLLTMVLADEITLGYQDVSDEIVVAVDGVKIRNLEQLVKLIDGKKEGLLTVELANHQLIVMDIVKMRSATPRIMQRYRIPADRSLPKTK